MLPGKYTATINGFTDENEKTPYSKNVYFEITEPKYLDAAYTLQPQDSTTVGTYYIKNGSTYVESKSMTPKELYEKYQQPVYARTGQPLY